MIRIGAWVAISTVLAVCCGASPSPPSYRLECQAWDNVTGILDKDEYTSESCTRNIQCTGFDCSGLYQYRGPFLEDQRVEIKYCFGVALHPCKEPVNLHFYIDMPELHVHFQKNVGNTTDLRIPGANLTIPDVGTVDGFISIVFERATINSHPYAKVGLTFKIRIQSRYSAISEWPKRMQRTLMPLTYIPIPPCEAKVVTPPHNPKTCKPFVPPSTTTQATTIGSTNPDSIETPTPKVTTLPKNSPATTGSKYMKPCKPLVAYECGANMVCSKNVCRCSLNFYFNYNLERCVAENTATAMTTPIFIESPYSTTDCNGAPDSTTDCNGDPTTVLKKNPTPIIIGCSVAGVVVVMGVIGTILFIRYRNHQRRYGNHQLLINNEEEEDDDPIDVST